ncbi:MAG: hypothetical protein GXN96_01880 [Aquificae bacterium]|nr:hypothetical protein [Aquificota bacterium]
MRKTLFKGGVALILSLLFLGAFLFAGLPKFLLLERELLKREIFTTARKVKENWREIELLGGRVFFRGEEVLSFDRALFSFVPLPRLVLYCGKEVLRAEFFPSGSLNLESDGFGCFKSFRIKKLELRVGEGIEGRLEVSQDFQEVLLTFRGRSFEGELRYMGMVFKGSGVVELRKDDLLKSKVNGEFRGNGRTVILSGTLERLTVRLR